ncbi:MAG: ATP-binding protein [Chloroflexi bacterium]|nr:ATP-binding protein [Chloroflexota bacterium]
MALLVVEEAHLFAPQVYAGACNDISEELAKRGRKRGLWTVWVTQRSADIAKRVISQCNLLLVGGMDHDLDFQAVKPRLPREVTFQDVTAFPPGRFYAAPPGRSIEVRKRHVTHGGETPGVGRPIALATEVKDASLEQAIAGLLEMARQEQDEEEREAGEVERLQAELEVASRETEEWKGKYRDLEIAARAAGLIKVELAATGVLPPAEGKTAELAPPGDNHRATPGPPPSAEPQVLPRSLDDLVVPRAVQRLLQHTAVRDLVEKAGRSGRHKDTRVASRHAWELVDIFARVQKAGIGEVALALGITHPRTANALRVQAQELVRAGVLRVADGGFALDRQSLERAATLYDIRQRRRRVPRGRKTAKVG